VVPTRRPEASWIFISHATRRLMSPVISTRKAIGHRAQLLAFSSNTRVPSLFRTAARHRGGLPDAPDQDWDRCRCSIKHNSGGERTRVKVRPANHDAAGILFSAQEQVLWNFVAADVLGRSGIVP